jgi:hypothetical protein
MLSAEPSRRLDLMRQEMYHRTNIERELSKNNVRSLPPSPRSVRTGFGRTDRTKSMQANC